MIKKVLCLSEQAARELLEEEWVKRTISKLPDTAALLASGGRMGSSGQNATERLYFRGP